MDKKWIGHLAVLTVYIIFGINPNCSKAVVPDYITPEAYTALRLAVGAAGFWLISLFTPREKVEKRDMGMIILGAVSLYGTLWAFAEAMRYISPTYVSLISAMSPLVVMLLAAVFLKEPISARKSTGVFFGISGALMMILFSLHGDSHYSNIGALLCFVNILFYAIYLLITRAVSPKYSPVTMMKWMFLYSFILSAPFAIPTVKDSPLLSGKAPAMAYVNMGIVALFATVLAYYLLPVKPALLNTQGGPRRGADGAVIDLNGDPIPHLFSAGECGGVTAFMYPGGLNVCECFMMGQIAGASAAKQK